MSKQQTTVFLPWSWYFWRGVWFCASCTYNHCG